MLKRGQFFLIAALIISGIVIGFGTLYNSAQIERADTQVYDFTEEIRSEIRQVHDSGTFAGLTDEQIETNTQNLLKHYAEQNPDSDFVVLYGNIEDVKVLYNDGAQVHVLADEKSTTETKQPGTVGAVGIQSVETQAKPEIARRSPNKVSKNIDRNKVKIEMKYNSEAKKETNMYESKQTDSAKVAEQEQKITREFQLSEGQNFYVIVRKKVNNEQVVVAR